MRKKSIFSSVGAILLAGVLAAGVCCMGYASRGDNGKWFGNGDVKTWHWKDNEIPDSAVDLIAGNMLMSDSEQSGIALTAYALSAEEYAENGVSEEAENAVKITVTFVPENTTDKEIRTSLSFADEQSNWALGKTASDYVTASVNEQEILLTCSEAFGEQIVLRIDTNTSNVFATVSIDYISRPTSIDCYLREHVGNTLSERTSTVSFGGRKYACRPEVAFGVGTITPNVRVDKYDITFIDQLLLDTNIMGPCSLKSVSVGAECISDDGNRDCYFRADRELLFKIIQSSSYSEDQILEVLIKATNNYPYGTCDCSYTIYYGDTVISSGLKRFTLCVDFSPLFVPAETISPDKDSVIF